MSGTERKRKAGCFERGAVVNKLLAVFFCMVAVVLSAAAEEALTAQAFLARARRPNPVDTFAMLSGRLQHRRTAAADLPDAVGPPITISLGLLAMAGGSS